MDICGLLFFLFTIFLRCWCKFIRICQYTRFCDLCVNVCIRFCLFACDYVLCYVLFYILFVRVFINLYDSFCFGVSVILHFYGCFFMFIHLSVYYFFACGVMFLYLFLCFLCFVLSVAEGVGERGRGEASPDLPPLKRLPDQVRSQFLQAEGSLID